MPVQWRGSQLAAETNFPSSSNLFFLPKNSRCRFIRTTLMHPPTKRPPAAVEKRRCGTRVGHGRGGVAARAEAGRRQKEISRRTGVTHFGDLFEVQPVRRATLFSSPRAHFHSIGPKMVICEVQEYSDLTYRVYDFGRVDAHGKPRELQVEKALQVTNFGKPAGAKVTSSASSCRWSNEIAARCLPLLCGGTLECSAKMRNSGRTRAVRAHRDSGKARAALPGRIARRAITAGECWLAPRSQARIDVLPETATSLIRDLCAGHSCNADRIATRWNFTGGARASYFRIRLRNDGEGKN